MTALLLCGALIFGSSGQSGPAALQHAPGDAAAHTPATERATELLEVASSGDPEVYAAFMERAYAPALRAAASPEVHLNFLAQLVDGTGGIGLRQIAGSADDEAVVVFAARLTGEWREFRLRVEPTAPFRITQLQPARPVPPPYEFAPQPRSLTPQEVERELDAYARALAAADVFSGAVLIARGGEVIFHRAYGAASREFNVANATDTRFIIGSINKMFTAVGILQLVERGKIGLQDAVEQHLPGVLPADVGRKVTIEHLLTHTSGLGDFLFVPEMQNRSRANYRTIDDYLPLLADATPRFDAGTGWSYSNAGFLLLGAVLEKVSGVPYDDYVAQHVFAPAGMTATGAPALDLVPTGLASTYHREFAGGRGRFRSDRYVQPVRGTPAGGGFSTARDLFSFMRALHGNVLLSPAMTQQMVTAKPQLGATLYGYGVQLLGADGDRSGHTGGGPGTAAAVEYDAKHDLVIVILGNQNTGSGAIHRRARQLLGAGAPSQSWSH